MLISNEATEMRRAKRENAEKKKSPTKKGVVLIKTRAKERTEKQVFKQRAQHRADSE
jgi:hypothetical protein